MIKSKKKLMIAAVSLFLCMIFIDEASVAVTLPQIQKDLQLSLVGTQWVMNAMFLPLAVMVLFGGKLSDYIGSRKTFSIGMIIFFIASIVCTFCPNGSILIIGRVFQGIGASFMLATYAVLISRLFPVEERGLALGSCASYGSIFLALGPLLGGVFSHYLSWRWVFALNLALAPVILWMVYKCVDSDEINSKHKESFDAAGLICFLAGFSGLVYSLMQAVVLGWDSVLIKVMISVSVLLLILFIFIELRVKSPLIDLKLFKNKTFLSGNIILFCTQVVVMCLTYWSIWLQTSLGMNAFNAGLALLPAGLPILIMGKVGGIWLGKYGPRKPILLGSIIVLLGMIVLALTATQNNYLWALLGFLGYGIGAPLIISPAIATVLNSVSDHQKGMAAGVLNTMRQLGGVLCFAVIGVIITNYVHIKTLHLQNTSDILAQTYSKGFSYGMIVSGVFALVSVLFAFFGLKKK